MHGENTSFYGGVLSTMVPPAMTRERPFDYVIVGAGSAGCVLAARLSANASTRVLLLEAGPTDAKMEVKIPAAFSKLFRTERDWAYSTTPQPGLAGRSLFWPRGKMLGGSSSMNAMMWVRGHRADYDAWAEACGDGWTWEKVTSALRRAEDRPGGPVDVYGRGGPLSIEAQRDPNVTTTAFLAACRELGWRELRDLNVPDSLGFARTPVNQKKGRRWSAADGYLGAARRRANLTVVTGATARRVVLEAARATGVEYTDARGALRVAQGGEIVLSAGAVNSPQLLMLSGIGPADHLRAHDVPVVVDRREVGENLQDHLVAGVIVHSPLPVTLVSAESPANLFKYLALKKGMLTSPVGEAVAFASTREGAAAQDIELVWAPVPYIDHGSVKPPGHGVTVGVVLLQPESRGTVRLASSDPRAHPVIDPRYLSDPDGRDVATFRAGVRLARRVLATKALAPYSGAPMEPAHDRTDDASLTAFIAEQAETLYHPVGTCRMGADDESVVDPELRVRGVAGLRVVDASVMPRINRGHTHAPTVAIAERAAEILQSTR
jgi:choline dehydrogenase